MAMLSILVRAAWDTEAELYGATSDDVPGLVTEAATPPELQKIAQSAGSGACGAEWRAWRG
jgi:hypothetical protein